MRRSDSSGARGTGKSAAPPDLPAPPPLRVVHDDVGNVKAVLIVVFFAAVVLIVVGRFARFMC